MFFTKKDNEHKIDWLALRPKLFRMVSVGVVDERVNQAYDVISTLALILNLTVSILNTCAKNMALSFWRWKPSRFFSLRSITSCGF